MNLCKLDNIQSPFTVVVGFHLTCSCQQGMPHSPKSNGALFKFAFFYAFRFIPESLSWTSEMQKEEMKSLKEGEHSTSLTDENVSPDLLILLLPVFLPPRYPFSLRPVI